MLFVRVFVHLQILSLGSYPEHRCSFQAQRVTSFIMHASASKYCFLNSFILFDWNGYDTFLCFNNRFGSVIKLMVWIHYGYGKEWRKFGCLLSYNAHSYTPKHYIKLLVFVVATTRRNAQQQQHDYYHYYYHLFIFLNCS